MDDDEGRITKREYSCLSVQKYTASYKRSTARVQYHSKNVEVSGDSSRVRRIGLLAVGQFTGAERLLIY